MSWCQLFFQLDCKHQFSHQANRSILFTFCVQALKFLGYIKIYPKKKYYHFFEFHFSLFRSFAGSRRIVFRSFTFFKCFFFNPSTFFSYVCMYVTFYHGNNFCKIVVGGLNRFVELCRVYVQCSIKDRWIIFATFYLSIFRFFIHSHSLNHYRCIFLFKFNFFSLFLFFLMNNYFKSSWNPTNRLL